MNYRHGYHAGNFADVFKHAVLARLVEYLKRKDGAFRVIDTHAGAGIYSLDSAESTKTGEWRDGIGRLLANPPAGMAAVLLEPYFTVAREHLKDGALRAYPGSPLIVRRLLRKRDRLSAFELHPDDHGALARLFAGDIQARITHLDGWLVPGAHLPPREKRGLLFVDPPFEEEDEFQRLLDALKNCHRRWPGGMACLWYPLKDGKAVKAFVDDVAQGDLPDVVNITIQVREISTAPGLHGCGLIVKNPPFVLGEELKAMLPALVAALGKDNSAGWTFERLTKE